MNRLFRDLIDFICYCFYNQNFVEKLDSRIQGNLIANLGLRAIGLAEKTANEAPGAEPPYFIPAADIRDLAKMAAPHRFCSEIRPVKDGS